jgi:predicted kinase
LTGSGKSTIAKTVVNQFPSFIRLSIDVYIYDKYGVYDKDYPSSSYELYQAEAKGVLRTRLRDLLRSRQNDVVLDFSFAFRETRDEYRRIVEEEGARSVLVYLECSEATLWKRIGERERSVVDADSAFKVTPEVLSRYLRGFEAPVDEAQIVIKERPATSTTVDYRLPQSIMSPHLTLD